MATGQSPKSQNTTVIFKKFVYSVWAVIIFYSIAYYSLGAYFSAAAVAIGVITLSPITLLLDQKGFTKTARLLFIFSCNFYIYATSLGLGHSINIEYYSLCAPMIGLLVCDFDDYLAIGFAVGLPVFTRILTIALGVSIIPESWIFIPEAKQMFMALNFFGSFGLSVLFISIFVKTIKEQRLQIITSAKMSSLGEMAGGVAHEINTPLAILNMRLEQIEEGIQEGLTSNEEILQSVLILKKTTERIGKIVNGLRFFARDGSADALNPTLVRDILFETLSFCKERFRSHGVEVNLTPENSDLQVNCRSVEISQVFLNLMNNSFDAIQPLEEKWIQIEITEKPLHIEISFKDSGKGIPKELHDKILQPFFTTKEIGKGTGIGLSLSKGIVESHGGKMYLDPECKNTRFVIELPKLKVGSSAAA